jgi:hypothetical protein
MLNDMEQILMKKLGWRNFGNGIVGTFLKGICINHGYVYQEFIFWQLD